MPLGERIAPFSATLCCRYVLHNSADEGTPTQASSCDPDVFERPPDHGSSSGESFSTRCSAPSWHRAILGALPVTLLTAVFRNCYAVMQLRPCSTASPGPAPGVCS